MARVSSIVCWPVDFVEDLECLLDNFGEVGPRWAWVDAMHGKKVAMRRAESESALPNRIVGNYLEL